MAAIMRSRQAARCSPPVTISDRRPAERSGKLLPECAAVLCGERNQEHRILLYFDRGIPLPEWRSGKYCGRHRDGFLKRA